MLPSAKPLLPSPTFALAPLLAILAGCAPQLLTSPAHNYALRSHGSTVVATRGVGGHYAGTLINGVADPERWDEGEGWEAPFVRRAQMEVRGAGLSRSRMASGYAQVEIRFPAPRRVNRVVVHALDSDDHPFKGIKRLSQSVVSSLIRCQMRVQMSTHANLSRPA